ncbi:hypothetical protein V1525DRAFT_253257 [Lipomyces kononenkoae]|uniref:Uncharacterized protein n=1 Tax=Lipomyces kononenkoae TaxID=34357 RepID=A0ACC3SY95_LIPKO
MDDRSTSLYILNTDGVVITFIKIIQKISLQLLALIITPSIPSIMSLPTEPQFWYRNGFIISTDTNLLSISSINHAFDQDFMYWTQPVPDHVIQSIVNNSFCFGLYKVVHNTINDHVNSENNIAKETSQAFRPEELNQIGFARLITDNVTFAYLTDLYVLPTYQGLGLGGWLLDCIDESLSTLPYLRWFMLRTAKEKSKESYEKRLGMYILQSGDIKEGPVMMGKKGKACRA